FERNRPPQDEILGAVDDSHAARPEFLDDAVMADRRADHRRIVSGWEAGEYHDRVSAGQSSISRSDDSGQTGPRTDTDQRRADELLGLLPSAGKSVLAFLQPYQR